MFKKFIFVGYSRRTSNYLKIIALSNLATMMSIVDIIAISVETRRINNECSLRKSSLN